MTDIRNIPVGREYRSKISVIDENKMIVKLDCNCNDFIFRRIKRIGECADLKYFATPCKHLKKGVIALEKQGYKLKIPEEMIGEDHLTVALKNTLLIRANWKCECGCQGTEQLQIHRKMRGVAGGKYNNKNCIVLTKECHRMRHDGEF